MLKQREILRILFKSYPEKSFRSIADAAKISHNTVSRYYTLIQTAKLDWNAIEALSDEQLKNILHPQKSRLLKKYINQINFQELYKELSKKGVTLLLLWQEYRFNTQSDISYTTFTRLYNDFIHQANLSYKNEHNAGERAYVDYSGMTLKIYEPPSYNAKKVEIFVGVMGASNYAYVEASHSQRSQDWINAHIRMFEYFGAIPQIIVPDNLKSAITQASKYDPFINPLYQAMAKHYNVLVMPTRPGEPKDKAVVENSVKIVQRWILARVRNDKFHSLTELNAKIKLLLEEYNHQKFQKIDTTRFRLFKEIDFPMMQSLPNDKFEVVDWHKSTVGLDYLVVYKGHAYSVPYQYAGKKVDLKILENLIIIICQNKVIAEHLRSYQTTGFTRKKEHMPKAHLEYLLQDDQSLLDWAENVGQFTLQTMESILKSKSHPEMGYKACLGLKKLARQYTEIRLEKACERAILINNPTFTSVSSILKSNLDQRALPHHPEQDDISDHSNRSSSHENIRGQHYYQGEES